MLGRLGSLARRVLGVTRESTYYLPWLTRPGLECVVLVNNIESRFTSGRGATAADLEATVTQYDAGGRSRLRDGADESDPLRSLRGAGRRRELQCHARPSGVRRALSALDADGAGGRRGRGGRRRPGG